MSNGEAAGAWTETKADDVADAIVAALSAGGVDHLFFTSGSEIGFYQEAVAKARAKKPTLLARSPLMDTSR